MSRFGSRGGKQGYVELTGVLQRFRESWVFAQFAPLVVRTVCKRGMGEAESGRGIAGNWRAGIMDRATTRAARSRLFARENGKTPF